MERRTIRDELKHQFRFGGMHVRLIAFNLAIFLAIGIGLMIERLMALHTAPITAWMTDIFTLPSSFRGLITMPWALFTSIFAHFSFGHFLSNMLFLYFAGSLFLGFFSGRRLLHVYVLGGIFGGLTEIIAHELFPIFITEEFIVGASGSVMAILTAIVAHRPQLQLHFFGIRIPVLLIAGLYLLGDLLQLGQNDHVAHFAHLGGALLGYLSVRKMHSSSNIINMSESFGQKFMAFFGNLFRPKTKMRVERGGGTRGAKTDEQYNMEAKERQKRIDAILDKISKSGYESLTKAEKEFLFSQSKRNG
jgi:membrane associated rhomboid family serine protease